MCWWGDHFQCVSITCCYPFRSVSLRAFQLPFVQFYFHLNVVCKMETLLSSSDTDAGLTLSPSYRPCWWCTTWMLCKIWIVISTYIYHKLVNCMQSCNLFNCCTHLTSSLFPFRMVRNNMISLLIANVPDCVPYISAANWSICFNGSSILDSSRYIITIIGMKMEIMMCPILSIR